jgi:hypothetical protein
MTMLALVLYELGTNAVKYGAWSGSKGVVEVRWGVAGGMLAMNWSERGGPPLAAPGQAGAGSRLIRGAISGASVDYRLERDGAKCRIELPLGSATATKAEANSGQNQSGNALISKFQAVLHGEPAGRMKNVKHIRSEPTAA